MKDKYKDFLFRLKDILQVYARKLWRLNWEAKIGLFMLIPPIIGTSFFLMTLLGINNSFLKDGHYEIISDEGYWDDYRDLGELKWYGWNFVYGDGGYIDGEISGGIPCQTMPTIPIYLGLMAIAGAYLIKGNLKSEK